MGLGPSLSIRQSQQLVLTPQLRQAIQLLQLSNLELDAFIAEELSKNPLLEAPSEEPDEQPAGDFAADDERGRRSAGRSRRRRSHHRDRPTTTGRSTSTGQSEALETDSFSDVVTSGGGEEAFDFERVQYSAASLAEHLLDQLHGQSGDVGDLARIIAETLDETGYLTVPLEQIAELTGAPLALVEQALADRPGARPAGCRCSLARRMPRAAGEGRRPLRSGDGAADRQSRPAVEGPHRPTSSASAGSTTRISPT